MKKIFLPMIFLSFCYAQTKYTESTNGYEHPFFGYKKEIIEKKDKKDEVKKVVTIPESLDEMSADQVQEYIKESQKIATQFQTDENIKNYIKLQNYAIKKAENFQNKWKQVRLENSSIDLAAPIAKGTFARNATKYEKNKQREQFWKENINKIGLVVFLDKDQEQQNTAQNRVLYFLSKDYPELVIKGIFKSEYPKLSKEKGVTVTPDTFMVYKDDNDHATWHRVKAGMGSKEEILDNIDFVYKYVIKGDKK